MAECAWGMTIIKKPSWRCLSPWHDLSFDEYQWGREWGGWMGWSYNLHVLSWLVIYLRKELLLEVEVLDKQMLIYSFTIVIFKFNIVISIL